MKQIRLQPLSKTYQQLSTLLCSTALSIQTTDYTKDAEWTRFIQQINKTFDAFKSHAEKEEDNLFPLIHGYEPALVAILRDDQNERMRYLNDLRNLLNTMHQATESQKSKLLSHKLLYRIDEFVASTLQQLREHENGINAVLWRYYSDKELIQIADALSIVPIAQTNKKDLSFADNIIKNIVPAVPAQPAYVHARTSKGYKQHRASKELAIAI